MGVNSPCTDPLPSVKISSLILTEGMGGESGGSVHVLGVKGRDS